MISHIVLSFTLSYVFSRKTQESLFGLLYNSAMTEKVVIDESFHGEVPMASDYHLTIIEEDCGDGTIKRVVLTTELPATGDNTIKIVQKLEKPRLP